MKLLGLVLAIAFAASGCGGSPAQTGPTLRVAAAPVLEPVLKRCTARIKGLQVRLEVADSSAIASEIRRGIKPDVFVAGNTGLPRALAREDRVESPQAFATNDLVIAVPAGDKSIRSLDDLARGDHSIAIGDASSPLGVYTRFVLGKLPTYERIQLLSHVRSQAPDAAAVLDKLVGQTVQAAILFGSEAKTAGDKVRTIALPGELGARVVYALAAVKGAPQPRAAERVVADILRGGCARALRDAGFGAPPR